MPAHDKHHFVPAFLLREWESGSDKKLSSFHWINNKLLHKRYKAKHVAKELGLYAMRDEHGGRDNVLEREFFARQIDDAAAVVHRRMIDSGLGALTVEDRVVWGRFVIAQMLRVPRMMTLLKSRGAEVFRKELNANPAEYEELRTDADPATLSEWVGAHLSITTGDNFALAALPSIVESELLHDVMRKATWGTINPRRSQHDLLIADHPLLYIGTMETNFLVILPICPRIAFVALSHDETARRMSRLPGSVFVRETNIATAGSADQYVYATNSDQEQLIASRLSRPSAACSRTE